jgi:hypothetical protein
MHCGHRAGLTPPGYQYPENNQDLELEVFGRNQRVQWDWYARTIDALQPVNFLIVNGDATDGKGPRTGGTEQINLDRTKQNKMAAEAIRHVRAEKIVMTYGTPYHVGHEEDQEQIIAGMVDAYKIGGHEWPEIEGVVFDVKHKIGSSTIPHGRATPLLRAALWNALWAEIDGQPRARVLIRSHTHYSIVIDTPEILGIITPGLQGWGSKFGVRECEGIIHIGLIHFDIYGPEEFTWHRHLLKPGRAQDMILKL